MISLEFAIRLANAHYSRWNKDGISFIADHQNWVGCEHGFIFFPKTIPECAIDRLGGSGCVLVTHNREVDSLWYFGNLDTSIERWEQDQCDKVKNS